MLCRKQFGKKAKVNFKIYGVTDWTTNNNNTYIIQYLKKLRQPQKKFVQLMKHKMRNVFFGNNTQNCTENVVPEPFIKNQN